MDHFLLQVYNLANEEVALDFGQENSKSEDSNDDRNGKANDVSQHGMVLQWVMLVELNTIDEFGGSYS